MARCAAIVLGSGAGSLDQLEATITSLERNKSGITPDIFVTLDPFTESAREWLIANKHRVAKAYTSPYHVGWPIMLNTVIDQQIEGGEWQYDIVVMAARGLTMEADGWLRWAIDEIAEESNENVISLCGVSNLASERNVIDCGDGTFIVPRLWGGVVTNALDVTQWRCVPYQPARGMSWLDDFGDFCTVNNRTKIYKPSLGGEFPVLKGSLSTFASFDGGVTYV